MKELEFKGCRLSALIVMHVLMEILRMAIKYVIDLNLMKLQIC